MATVKVLVHAAQGLPVMDRASKLCDAYLWIRLDDQQEYSATVYGTRNPSFKHLTRFDVPNLHTLQENPVEVHVYDKDRFMDDLVGTAFVDLNSILYSSQSPRLETWFPLIDPLEGLHGEVHVSVWIKFHGAANPFVPIVPIIPFAHGSSSPRVLQVARRMVGPRGLGRAHSLVSELEGVVLLHCSSLDPARFRVLDMYGMVEELLFKDDPENKRAAYVNPTRKTLHARAALLFALSGKVRRQMSKKVLELGCNCVLGYRESFDVDELNGVVVRAVGTPCLIVQADENHAGVRAPKILIRSRHRPHLPGSRKVPVALIDSGAAEDAGKHAPRDTAECARVAPTAEEHGISARATDATEGHSSAVENETATPERDAAAYEEEEDDELWPEDEMLGEDTKHESAAPAVAQHRRRRRPEQHPSEWFRDTTKLSRYQVIILTLTELPAGAVQRLAGTVTARSVKAVFKLKSKATVLQERDEWWAELRDELRANTRALSCNVVMGYVEEAVYEDDVVVMSVTGTAVAADDSWEVLRHGPQQLARDAFRRARRGELCRLLHIPREADGHSLRCAACEDHCVPSVLLLNTELPRYIPTVGEHSLIDIRVSKEQPKIRGHRAQAVAQVIPFLEYALHRQIVFRLRMERFNCVYNLNVRVSFDDGVVVGTAVGTAARVTWLPVLPLPELTISGDYRGASSSLARVQGEWRKVQETAAMRSSLLPRGEEPPSEAANDDGVVATEPGETAGGATAIGGLASSGGRRDSSTATTLDAGSSEATGSSSSTARYEFVMQIDDDEDADHNLGTMAGLGAVVDARITTAALPRDPSLDHATSFVIQRLYKVPVELHHIERLSSEYVSKCSVDARRSVALLMARVGLQRNCETRVTAFRCDSTLLTSRRALLLKLSGAIVSASPKGRSAAAKRKEYITTLARRTCGLEGGPPSSLPSTTSSTSSVDAASDADGSENEQRPAARIIRNERMAIDAIDAALHPFTLPFLPHHSSSSVGVTPSAPPVSPPLSPAIDSRSPSIAANLIVTPSSFVPNGIIVKYLGRVSQHFIRRCSTRKDSTLGAFWSSTLFEAESVVAAVASGLGGNAVLDYRVLYHEIEALDSTSTALFFSVTGHVATVELFD